MHSMLFKLRQNRMDMQCPKLSLKGISAYYTLANCSQLINKPHPSSSAQPGTRKLLYLLQLKACL